MDSVNSARITSHLAKFDRKQQACCSSPSSMCYWCVVSVAAWGLLSLLGFIWHPLHARSAATILFAAAIGCFANGSRIAPITAASLPGYFSPGQWSFC